MGEGNSSKFDLMVSKKVIRENSTSTAYIKKTAVGRFCTAINDEYVS